MVFSRHACYSIPAADKPLVSENLLFYFGGKLMYDLEDINLCSIPEIKEYLIKFDEEEQEYRATCPNYPDLSWSSINPVQALIDLNRLIRIFAILYG